MYTKKLDQVTRFALSRNFEQLEALLGLSPDLLRFSDDCVGRGLRKGTLLVGHRQLHITHFAHMCRTAFLVKHFFPKDLFGRNLAMVHDIKEEPLPGKEDEWRNADRVAHTKGLAHAVTILTEVSPTKEEIAAARAAIPLDLDVLYVAKYKKFIVTLRNNWGLIGNLELCDRLDGASSFSYLEAAKYSHRRKYKALETFGRIWATLALSDHTSITTQVKDRCRHWFPKFGVTEDRVESVALYFAS
jgi:hypothetical protein